jgi:hypothetical protein
MNKYTRSDIAEAVIEYVNQMDRDTMVSIIAGDLEEYFRKSATEEEIDELMKEVRS